MVLFSAWRTPALQASSGRMVNCPFPLTKPDTKFLFSLILRILVCRQSYGSGATLSRLFQQLLKELFRTPAAAFSKIVLEVPGLCNLCEQPLSGKLHDWGKQASQVLSLGLLTWILRVYQSSPMMQHGWPRDCTLRSKGAECRLALESITTKC